MSDIICVTNRKLCSEDFFTRLEKIVSCRPKAVILREKDLAENEYKILAERVLEICSRYNTPCILHSFVNTAIELNWDKIHLPMHIFRELDDIAKNRFELIGVSCHSLSEAKEAENLGAGYIIAGHIFATDCKKGLEPRGLGFLREICDNISIPVCAIGGINTENIGSVRRCGASGACIMSRLMNCRDDEINELINGGN